MFREMSPAMTEELQSQPDTHLDQLQAVGKAFDALLLTLHRLTHRHNELKHHTEEIFKQVTTPSLTLPALSPPPPGVSNDERI